MEESNHPDPLVHAIRRDGANAIHGGHARLTVIVHDDRNIQTQIAPGPREQYVLHRFAADVAVRAVARQHGVVLEPDDADLRYRHTSGECLESSTSFPGSNMHATYSSR